MSLSTAVIPLFYCLSVLHRQLSVSHQKQCIMRIRSFLLLYLDAGLWGLTQDAFPVVWRGAWQHIAERDRIYILRIAKLRRWQQMTENSIDD
ncbi:hypothetical protein [Marinomonas shanghaiensis]|uniref:hypothetical protein n=1 Tax=Marinomonas shanghaiensis TaxID=2202418 RepID=UPI003A94E85A